MTDELKSGFKISLFQVSDIHWSQTNLGDDSFEGQIRLNAHNRFMEPLCDPKFLSDKCGFENILILGGDNVGKSDYTKFDSFCENILFRLLALRRPDDTTRSYFDAVVAVPGNHDIEREESDKCRMFKKKFEEAYNLQLLQDHGSVIPFVTPFSDPPFYSIATPFVTRTEAPRAIQIWAVNSTEVCGYLDQNDRWVRDLSSELLSQLRSISNPTEDVKLRITEVERIFSKKIRPHDPGYVDERDLTICRNLLKNQKEFGADLFRIAVIHHNSVPFRNDDQLKYKFWNANEFNCHILDHKFRLVLHGHQHIGDVCLFSKSKVTSGKTRSYLADGFLSVGAPSFDCMAGGADDTGFNVVQLHFATSHQICEVRIYQTLAQDKQRFVEKSDSFDMALDHIPEGDIDRWLILPAVNRILYSKQRLDGLARAVDDYRFSVSHSSTLRGFLGKFKQLNSVYAVSVFPPGLWVNTKVPEVFLPHAKRVLSKAIRDGVRFFKSVPEESEPPLLFSFSSPLCGAIKAAIANSRQFPPLEDLARTLKAKFTTSRQATYHQPGRSQIQEFLRRGIQRIEKGAFSLSVWASAVFVSDTNKNVQAPIMVKELKGRPHAAYGEKQRAERRFNSTLLEFPRIVLWDREDFRCPSALDVIEYHENLGLPLFWLSRQALEDSTGKKREEVGYVAAVALTNEHDDVVSMADVICHMGNPDQLTQPLETSRFWEVTWGNAKFSRPTDKDRMMGIDYTLDTGRHPLHEFLWLLSRRHIMFAADVWCFANSEDVKWEKFVREAVMPDNPDHDF